MFPRVDLLEKPANILRVRFNEAKISVGIFLISSATDPKAEVLIHHVNAPAPIFGERLFGLQSLRKQFFAEKFGEPLAPKVRVDLVLLTLVGGEPVRPKFHVRLHLRQFVKRADR